MVRHKLYNPCPMTLLSSLFSTYNGGNTKPSPAPNCNQIKRVDFQSTTYARNTIL